MHVVITGGAGFIGSHLCDLHLALGDSVQVVDDLSGGRIDHLSQHAQNPNFSMDIADVSEWDGLHAAVEAADRVYHLAAIVGLRRVLADPLHALDVNTKATRRVLDAAVSAQRPPAVLVASSAELYGRARKAGLRENENLVNRSPNSLRWSNVVAKMMDEAVTAAVSQQHGLRTVTARLFNTIGPRQGVDQGAVVPQFVRQAVVGKPLTVFGDGSQTRAFCDVRDTVRALKQLLDVPRAAGRTVNVGHDREISIDALAQLIIERAQSPSARLRLSYAAAYGGAYRDCARCSPRLRLLKALTGFKYQWTLERTLDDLIARERQRLPRQALAVARRSRHAA